MSNYVKLESLSLCSYRKISLSLSLSPQVPCSTNPDALFFPLLHIALSKMSPGEETTLPCAFSSYLELHKEFSTNIEGCSRVAFV